MDPNIEAFLELHAGEPDVEWGRDDCVTFTGNGVLVATGVDLIEEYRGAYSSFDEAELFLEEMGGSLYKNALRVLKKNGFEKTDPGSAPLGSVGALIGVNKQVTFGFGLGNGFFAFRTDGGVGFVSNKLVGRAWCLKSQQQHS